MRAVRADHHVPALQNFCISANVIDMKTTLIVSSRGVVTLPAKLRQALGINADDHVIAEATPDGILLRPAATVPIEVYSAARIKEFDAAEADLAKLLGNAMGKDKPRAKVAKVAKAAKPHKTRRVR